MARSNPADRIRLSPAERRVLRDWSRSRTHPIRLRARIVLGCAAGLSQAAVARSARVSLQTVRKWGARFAATRLAGLGDKPRPGAPRRLDDLQVERLMRLIRSPNPPGRKQWTSRALAEALGLSQSTVIRLMKRLGQAPKEANADL